MSRLLINNQFLVIKSLFINLINLFWDWKKNIRIWIFTSPWPPPGHQAGHRPPPAFPPATCWRLGLDFFSMGQNLYVLLLFIVIEGILLIPEIKDKIRINVQVWRDGGDGYESYLQEAGQPPCALAAPPHPPPGPQHPQAGPRHPAAPNRPPPGPQGSTWWWRTPQPSPLCWPATCWRPMTGSASRWGFCTLLPFLFIIIIAGLLLSSDRMGQNIFLNPRQSC